jgi:Domain of unknown function (DUF4331)
LIVRTPNQEKKMLIDPKRDDAALDKEPKRPTSRDGWAGFWATFAVAAAVCVAQADASSHREAPAITGMPKFDGTDFYMFRSYEQGRDGYVTLIANYQPLQDPYGGPNYFELGSNGIYEIHIDNNGDGLDDITFQFKFTNTREDLTVNVGGQSIPIPLVQLGTVGVGGDPSDVRNLNVRESYTVSVIRRGQSTQMANVATRSTVFENPVDNIGFKTLPDYAAYAAALVYNVEIPGCSGNGRVFVGQRKDPFVVNLGETFDLINITNPIGEANNNAARDDIADKNVTSLILEVPISCLIAKDPVIGAWTSANSPNASTQVSRLGMPLVNELVIGLPDKDAFNASQPTGDSKFLKYVTNPSLPTIVQVVFGGAVTAPHCFRGPISLRPFSLGSKGSISRSM